MTTQAGYESFPPAEVTILKSDAASAATPREDYLHGQPERLYLGELDGNARGQLAQEREESHEGAFGKSDIPPEEQPRTSVLQLETSRCSP